MPRSSVAMAPQFLSPSPQVTPIWNTCGCPHQKNLPLSVACPRPLVLSPPSDVSYIWRYLWKLSWRQKLRIDARLAKANLYTWINKNVPGLLYAIFICCLCISVQMKSWKSSQQRCSKSISFYDWLNIIKWSIITAIFRCLSARDLESEAAQWY